MGPRYDAAVVLGAGTGETARARVLRGIQAFSESLCSLLLLLGNREEADYMLRLASERVPTDRIVANADSTNTVDNAYYAKRIAQRLGLKKLALITSRLHMKRALAIFRHLFGSGFVIHPLEADDNPREEDVKREELLRAFIPLLTLFEEGDDEEIRKAAATLEKALVGT